MAATTEVQRIADQLKRAYEGPAWHGPALCEVLEGVGKTRAAARPIAKAHSIWEITLHIAAWERAALRMIGGAIVNLTPEEDWPAIPRPDTAAWKAALATLGDGHMELRAGVETIEESRLGQRVQGREYSFYVLLHGVVQHDLYHAGQIAVLKKP